MLKDGVASTPGRLVGAVTGMSVGMGVGPTGRLRGGAQATSSRVRMTRNKKSIRYLIKYLLLGWQGSHIVDDIPALTQRQVFSQRGHLAESLHDGKVDRAVKLAGDLRGGQVLWCLVEVAD